MRVLITGITGFVGSHMADYLLENVPDIQIFASRRWRSKEDNIKHLFGDSRVIFEECDLTDRGSLQRLIRISKPDVVYHFAAQSFPGSSFLTPISTLTTNVLGTTNLMEELKFAIDNGECDPVILSVSSSEVYGMPEEGDDIPILETNPIRAANPYSISKVGQDLISQYYHKAYGMKIIITRMFSHEGKRRGKRFALSSFARQIVQAEKGLGDYNIHHGNLDSVRTYNHIEDAIEAYWLALNKCEYGTPYNIGGDDTRSIGEALDLLISKSTISDKLVKYSDDKLYRPTDITLQIPSSEKFRKKTGWKPTKNLDDICDDLLNHWRGIL